jgi:hypothetical protein
MSERRIRNTDAIGSLHWAVRGVAATAIVGASVFSVAGLFSLDDSAHHVGPAASSENSEKSDLDVITAAADARSVKISRSAERAPLAAVDTHAAKTLYVTAATTAIRADAGEESPVLATLKKRESVKATGAVSGGWTQVDHNDLPRWVKTADLAAKKPEVAPTEGAINTSPCARTASIEGGLQPATIKAVRAVCHRFPDIAVYGGRQARGTHGGGYSVDVMVGAAEGQKVSQFLLAHAKEYNLDYVIHLQRIWAVSRDSGWRPMADRGGATANHMDHVHFTTIGG